MRADSLSFRIALTTALQPARHPHRAGQLLGAAAAAAALTVAAGCMQTTVTGNTPIAPPDRLFVQKAATSGANEIQMSRVAQQKASNPAVRSFAAQMIQDHTSANTQLKDILSTKGVVATEAPDAEHVAALAKLSAMSGADFDSAYMQQMVVDHQIAVTLFDTEARNGSDRDITTFATTTLPILRGHLQMAQQMAGGGAMR